jgi:nucleoside-diphosphate-sugar epimerase
VVIKQRRVLVTGGLGFIGSNLAIRLVQEGASVTIVDPLIVGCGGNRFNVEPVAEYLRIVEADIGEPETFRDAIRSADIIYNLAGEISHLHSMWLPERDLQINTVAQLRFLEACRRENPGVRIVYAGTRQVYGVPDYLPVDEKHPVNPVDFNGVHKYAASQYHLMLTRIGELDAIVLRLTNVFGPRMALDAPCQGFLGTYVRRALFGQTLEIFGDGRQVRDPVYVDDVVEAFLLAALEPHPASRTYNVGGPTAISLAEIACAMAELSGAPRPVFREFPSERAAIDIGSYRTDSRLIAAELGWIPKVSFREGVERTLNYFRGCLERYIDPHQPDPLCRLAHRSEKTETPLSVQLSG